MIVSKISELWINSIGADVIFVKVDVSFLKISKSRYNFWMFYLSKNTLSDKYYNEKWWIYY